MKRVLVTGATGFTARYVIPLLRRSGYEVRGLSTADCDIRDAVALNEAVAVAQPQFVIHLAGTPNLSDAQADAAFSINVQGTANLLESCARLASKPTRIILASSCYVYGDTGAVAADEISPLTPAGAYGRSKLEMERVAARWRNRLPILVVRPFNYTGVGHDFRYLVPKLVRAFQERRSDVSFVASDIVRDFSDVRWVAKVYVAMLSLECNEETLNVCSGVGTSLPALVDLLEGLTGHRPARRPVSPEREATGSVLVGSPARLSRLQHITRSYALIDTLKWMLDGR